MHNNKDNFSKQLITPGTLPCAIGCVIVAVFTALLLLWAGIWQTLLFAALVAAGVFVGGVKDKGQFIRKLFGVHNDIP